MIADIRAISAKSAALLLKDRRLTMPGCSTMKGSSKVIADTSALVAILSRARL
jgi:hypothetical protein